MSNRKSFAPSLSALEPRDLKTASVAGGVLTIAPAAGPANFVVVQKDGDNVNVVEFDGDGVTQDTFAASSFGSISCQEKGTYFNEFLNMTDFSSTVSAAGYFNDFINMGSGHADFTGGGEGTSNVVYEHAGDAYHGRGGSDAIFMF